MSQLTLAERIQVARLFADRTRRGAVARALGSRLLRWRYRAPIADEILLIPQDLRTCDPSFAIEVAQGHFGLAGRSAYLKTGSPFDLRPPSAAWSRELHGFVWLRHMRDAGNPRSTRIAQSLVSDWIRKPRGHPATAWEPAVVARRIISWIVNANLLLEDADRQTYDRIMGSMASQYVQLSAGWRQAPDGHPRLLSLIALAYGDLCLAGHEQKIDVTGALLSAELDRQIYPDGGHLSRNPGVLVELLLDLLPLRQCYVTRQKPLPKGLEPVIARILPMLRFMRLGDGGLARFNGMGSPSLAALATVLAYDSESYGRLEAAPQSAYARLECGSTVLIADVGAPPSLELASQAHAGCLSFEMSVGAIALLVNGGAPGPAEQERRAASRSTASHNTLSLGDKSSSRILVHPLLDRLIGGAPIRNPRKVSCKHDSSGSGAALDASHDGYEGEFGLLHRRSLALSADGASLQGIDVLGPARGALRLARDVPFAIHFHLHPKVTCARDAADAAIVTLRNAETWRFTATGAQLSIEPSMHFADMAGPARSAQIVLRGACFGDNEIRWRLDRLGDGATAG